MEGQYRIDSLFAFIVVDDDGTEGVPALASPMGPIAMMGADLARVKSLEPHAQAYANASGKTVSLVHFSVRTLEKEIKPQGGP
jgi:hypothetical protein